jgi:hypothetical protein
VPPFPVRRTRNRKQNGFPQNCLRSCHATFLKNRGVHFTRIWRPIFGRCDPGSRHIGHENGLKTAPSGVDYDRLPGMHSEGRSIDAYDESESKTLPGYSHILAHKQWPIYAPHILLGNSIHEEIQALYLDLLRVYHFSKRLCMFVHEDDSTCISGIGCSLLE